ncbi:MULTISPECIES: hypothetical protein [Gammaproteobacteria]|uniref:hypothetical protein n=1 Tax=Gammaproteobacteria TaxID=1236 RepID=UPI002FC9E20E
MISNIKICKPSDIKVGDMVLTGYTGKKTWRKVAAKFWDGEYRRSIHMADGWNVSAGSECKFLVKVANVSYTIRNGKGEIIAITPSRKMAAMVALAVECDTTINPTTKDDIEEVAT